MSKQRGYQGLLWLACLVSGQASWAAPVLFSSGQESAQLTPLTTSANPHAQRPQPGPHLPARLQSLDEAASVAPMNELLTDVAKHAPSAAMDAVLGTNPAQPRREQGSQHDLLRSAVKELEVVADVKNVLQGVRTELHQITGGHLASIEDERAAERASLTRRIEERQSQRYGDGSIHDRPRSEAEIMADAQRASFLVRQLIDEITPWAIAAGVLFALFHGIRAMLRVQAARQLKLQTARAQSRSRRSSRSHSSSRAYPRTPI
ncbi:hypothetical protein [Roseateles sp.]|uniref:hypothetical protein n=1 Tax=Roseateles sp. TaxID=1971397 RepID=UPI003BA3E43F